MLIVGLGNPGVQYQNNRHNIGFILSDLISEHYQFSSYKQKFKGLFSSGEIENKNVFLLKPQTYMNLSGDSVIEFMNFYKIPSQNVIVVHDEIDLEFGDVRVKLGGGSAGHNGLKSIDERIGNQYIRIRIGVGKPEHRSQVSDYVLSDFSASEKEKTKEILSKIAKNISVLIKGDLVSFGQLVKNVAP